MDDYSDLSHTLTKKLNKDIKKIQGIYFTPPKTIQSNISYLEPYMDNINTILEPSCGSCEFIRALTHQYPTINITGIEYNTTIFNDIADMATNTIHLINDNYIEYHNPHGYDLIIGNPPYSVIKKKDIPTKYYPYFDGRPNLFIIFILRALDMLNDNGILSYVLPKSFINCIYYDKTRQLINDNYKILNIIECNDKYIETQQETLIIIIQKTPPLMNNTQFSLSINNNIVFGTPDNIKTLRTLYNGTESLSDLGFKVSVGNVVWNQCKSILTDDPLKTRLIYSSDITDTKLGIKNYRNLEKKNYIMKKGLTSPLLVINRGYGIGNYNFEYCLIEGGFEYLIENHLICITYTNQISNMELITLYKKIIKSLESPRTKEFIKLYFGNSAINTTELAHMLPIYDYIL
jgi:type I restriction-modification system DNA methylase subunit